MLQRGCLTLGGALSVVGVWREGGPGGSMHGAHVGIGCCLCACLSVHGVWLGVAVRACDLWARTTQGEHAHYFWCPHPFLTAPWN